jgi:general secretion pathway protein D
MSQTQASAPFRIPPFPAVAPPQRPGRRVAAAALALALAATAQDPPQPPQQPPAAVQIEPVLVGGEPGFRISIDEREGLLLKQFIKIAEQITERTFIFSDQELAQVPDPKVTFLGVKKIKKANFFGFFQTILYIKGFACVPRGEEDTEIWEIIFMNGPKRSELTASVRYVTPDELVNYRNQTGVTVLTSIPVEHIQAVAAVNSLRPFFIGAGAASPTGQLTFGNVGNAKAVLISGFAPQVYAAYQILKLVDLPVDPVLLETRVQRLEHQAAEELEPLINEILSDRAGVRQQAGDPGAGQPVQTGQPIRLKVLAHSTQNALLLSGTPEQIFEAVDLIAHLDVPVEAAGGDQHVVVLKNVLANDLRTTLNDFLQADQTAEQQAQQGGQTPARRPRRTVVIAHEESNSLLISGTASKYAQLKKTIDQLDRRQPQVLIECALVELSIGQAQQLGVELGFIDIKESGDFTRGFGFTSFGLTTFEDTDDDGLPDTRLPDFENPLQGLTGGIISNDDFAIPVIVNALASSDAANVLSMPSVVVNNNQEAEVRSEEIRPTQEIQQNTTGSQQGAGEDKSAGIELLISPSISTNNYLRLNLSLMISRFTTAFDPNSVTAGVRTTREIKSQVTMPSGHTMVIGGVIQDVESEAEAGIPLLKDIPILGILFRTKTTERSKTNLYFFLTPHILDEADFSDLAELSFRKKLEAAEYIGHRRLQIVDRKWREQAPETLEDSGATLEDLDMKGGFTMPVYQRPGTTGPTGPDELNREAPRPVEREIK